MNIYNKGLSPFDITVAPRADGKPAKVIRLEPGATAEVPEAEAKRLVAVYPRELVDAAKLAVVPAQADLMAENAKLKAQLAAMQPADLLAAPAVKPAAKK